ncbi:MAG: permease [Thiohalospira sp.]
MSNDADPRTEEDRATGGRWRMVFNPTNGFFAGVAALAAWALAEREGRAAVETALWEAGELLLLVAPILVSAVLISGYVQTMVPRDAMERWLGRGSGLRGLTLAAMAGALTPGGPFAAFPLVVALWESGAGFGVCVAYLTSWSVLGIQRALVWEIPLLGADFVLLRLAASLLLPLIAGVLADRLDPARHRGRR